MDNMGSYCLAVDIGASSGRHMLGHLRHGKMELEEIYRFENGMIDVGGVMCWDTERLFHEIKEGMRRCARLGKIPVSVGVDTWGVDFVLLDRYGRRLGDAVAYRDSRTRGVDGDVYKRISEERLYARTGIQKQIYNTIYQLMAVKMQMPHLLDEADALLMTPDYYHYLLTGKKAAEYTIGTTGQLVSPATKDWDWELIDILGYPKRIFAPMRRPGTVLGCLTSEVQREVGFNCQVILPPSHDTASAVLAVPANERAIYISSGTWSLMGVERTDADASPAGRARNFTNEGGYDYRFRYLKNIMGLWMIQSVKKECGDRYTFAELCDMAEKETIGSIVDCYDGRFLSPDSMSEEIRAFCGETGQQIPMTLGGLAAVIYNSLAKCYADTAREIEAMTGNSYACIHVVGGGSNAAYLNRLTAEYTGKTVYAGPAEATAIGNILSQMLARGELSDVATARECVLRSFDISIFTSSNDDVGKKNR